MSQFIHLHVHSAFSLSEGALHTDELIDLCLQNDMPAVAVTDTNNLFGALEQSTKLAEKGIQPIVGCQLAVAWEDPAPHPGATNQTAEAYPVVLLVQNETGYRNLIKLVSKAFLDADSGVAPHVMLATLQDYSQGMICLTGGPAGPVGQALLQNRPEVAESRFLDLHTLFGDRLYVEIMRHNTDEERLTEPAFLDLAYDHDVPLVATNDVYFARQELYEAHDALLCIAEGAYVSQSDRRQVTREHYFKTAKEMEAAFGNLPEALANTVVIAQRCAFKVPLHDPILPRFAQDGRDEAEELRRQAMDGLKDRLEEHVFTEEMDETARQDAAKPYWDRLEHELEIIIRMDFPGYFLIVADFIQWAKDHDVPVGPGRGSGAGSLVAWSLLITDLDPIRFGLLFERFLNPERVSMPDFDVDFCQDKRDQVIRYVQDKYGHDQVAQIITFGKLQARAALRDVGRVLELPYGLVDRLCKMVPNNPAKPTPLVDAVAEEPRLQYERDRDENVAEMLDTAIKLEGLYRHASTHAAGVVIGDRPLDELIPLYRDPRSPMPVTQFNMKWVEPAGLVKFDFLGLKTLTVIDRTVALLRRRGIEVDHAHLPLDDGPTFEMLGKGDAIGVFQLEGTGMRDTLKRLKPDVFEDIIALVSLYRPGPMDNIPTFIRRKHGLESIEYPHEWLKPILEETYGVIIYQEQVMQIAQELSGFTLGQADLLRRAMGKKQLDQMEAMRVDFLDGAEKKGVARSQADTVFELVRKFAEYGFNKSHAAAYAMVSYQTAYLKANYPVEFLAASMSLDINNTDKLKVFRDELGRLGIPLLPPDVNASFADFATETLADGGLGVRYALGAIKNVGMGAMDGLVREREAGGRFSSLAALADRLDPRLVNKRQLENLTRAGALDVLHGNRAETFSAIEQILRRASYASGERDSSQENLFGDTEKEIDTLRIEKQRDWRGMDKLNAEKDAVGFYLTAHPLDTYRKALAQQNVLRWSDALERIEKGASSLKVAGVLSKMRERKSQRGRPFAFVEFSDPSGSFEVTFFSELLNSSRDLLELDRMLVLTVEARMEEDSPRLVAQRVEALEDVVSKASAGLRITLEQEAPLRDIQTVLSECRQGTGYVHLMLDLPDGGRRVELTLPERYRILPEIQESLDHLSGIVEVEFI